MIIKHKKRVVEVSLFLLVSILLYVVNNQYAIALYQPAFFTGWMMICLILFLVFFNVRKKIPYVPMGRAKHWSQWHYYVGIVLGVMFLLHIEFQFPTGVFETLLFYVVVIEILSGVYGLYISRMLPKRFSKRGEYVIFERIPAFRYQLKLQIETLVASAIADLQSSAITEFYSKQLEPNMLAPKHFFLYLVDSSAPFSRWDTQFEAVNRYMDEKEIEVLNKIKSLFYKKMNLDFLHANQAMLKYWLFLHIPISYALIVFVLFHILFVYSFTSTAL